MEECSFNLLSEILSVQASLDLTVDEMRAMFQSLERDSVCSSQDGVENFVPQYVSFNLLSEILSVQAGFWPMSSAGVAGVSIS